MATFINLTKTLSPNFPPFNNLQTAAVQMLFLVPVLVIKFCSLFRLIHAIPPHNTIPYLARRFYFNKPFETLLSLNCSCSRADAEDAQST